MAFYWGWAILVAALVVRTLVHGIVGSYGVFLEKFSRVFGDQHMTIIGWVGATAYGLVNAGTPLMLILYKRIGPRKTAFIGVIFSSMGLAISAICNEPMQIFFSYGVMTGLGMLCTIIPPFFILDTYFPLHNKYHVLTTSMLMCTLPLGSLIFNPVTQRMIHFLGWRMTFSTFGIALFFVGGICASTYRQKGDKDVMNDSQEMNERRKLTDDVPETNSIASDVETAEESLEEKIPRKAMILMSCLWFFTKFMKSFGYFGPFFIMVKHLTSMGIPPKYGALAMTVISGSELIGRLLTSFIGDRYIKGRFLYLYAICSILLAAENLMAAVGNTFVHMVIFGVLAGLTGGPVIAGVFATCAEVLDGPYVHELFTVCRVGLGTGMIVGAIVSGAIYDKYHSYRGVFYMNVGIFIITSMCYLSIVAIRNHVIRKRYTNGYQMKWR